MKILKSAEVIFGYEEEQMNSKTAGLKRLWKAGVSR